MSYSNPSVPLHTWGISSPFWGEMRDDSTVISLPLVSSRLNFTVLTNRHLFLFLQDYLPTSQCRQILPSSGLSMRPTLQLPTTGCFHSVNSAILGALKRAHHRNSALGDLRVRGPLLYISYPGHFYTDALCRGHCYYFCSDK